MTAAYFTINNISKVSNVMEKGMKDLEHYYSSTHRMFASFKFLLGYYLMQNEKSSEVILWLKTTYPSKGTYPQSTQKLPNNTDMNNEDLRKTMNMQLNNNGREK